MSQAHKFLNGLPSCNNILYLYCQPALDLPKTLRERKREMRFLLDALPKTLSISIKIRSDIDAKIDEREPNFISNF
jgi:hypothetical protein